MHLRCLLWVLWVCLPLALAANGADELYRNSPPPAAGFQSAEWKKLADGVDFREGPLPEKKKKNQADNPYEGDNGGDSGGRRERPSSEDSNDAAGPGGLVQGLLFGGVLALLIFLVYRLATGGWFLTNPSVRKELSFEGETVDAAVPETALERMLREAVSAREYRLAVRLYYLMALRKLSDQGALRWQRDKTNMAYLRELSGTPWHAGFREVTRRYERVWFSDYPFSEPEFRAMQPAFDDFIRSVK